MRTIHSLNLAKRPERTDIKILVIANACEDDTISTLNTQANQQTDGQDKLPLYVQEELVAGKSNALNRAINLINEGYICFIDDDQRVDTNYFNAVNSAITQYPSIAMFCGQLIPDWTGTEPAWIHDQGKYKIYPLPVPEYRLGHEPLLLGFGQKLPSGGNLIVHRNVFDSVGNFSVALGPKGHDLSGSEDSEFLFRALKQDKQIQYFPGIIQFHYVDPERLGLGYLVRKSFQRTRSLTRTKHSFSGPIPLYLWRKLFQYTMSALFAFNSRKIRFYLMRIASTTGEIIGRREA